MPLGSFTVLFGSNASGKSNLRDVMRFLNGISRGYKLVELLAGKFEGNDRIWAGVRGGPNKFIRSGAKAGDVEVIFTNSDLSYRITLQEVRGKPIRVYDEWLKSGQESLFSTRDSDGFRANLKATKVVRVWLKAGGDHRRGHTEDVLNDEPVISQIEEFLSKRNDDKGQLIREGVDAAVTSLSAMRFLDLSPNAMREPTYPGPLSLGDSGENLSTVLQNLVDSGGRERDIREWLNVLTPMDVAALDFEKDSRGRISLVLVEHDKRRTSAESASDGTLRFLAYLALAFSTTSPTTCFVEEIDNGIHPSRLQLLVELVETQSKDRNLQVVASSHSPALMNLLSDETLASSALVYRTDKSPSSKVKMLRDLPNFLTIAKKRQPGALMEAGWFENTVESLDFVDDKDEDEE